MDPVGTYWCSDGTLAVHVGSSSAPAAIVGLDSTSLHWETSVVTNYAPLIFPYDGGNERNLTVLNGTTSLTVHMWGGGGGGSDGGAGGAGAYITGRLPVTVGETLRLIVGRGGNGYFGGSASKGELDGGGGAGGYNGGGGGGRTTIQRAVNGSWADAVTAGGGGGGGGCGSAGGAAAWIGASGNGSSPGLQPAFVADCWMFDPAATGGIGGTGSSPGWSGYPVTADGALGFVFASPGFGNVSSAAAAGSRGRGGDADSRNHAGGGGGGYYGGGAAANAGGGAGSSYTGSLNASAAGGCGVNGTSGSGSTAPAVTLPQYNGSWMYTSQQSVAYGGQPGGRGGHGLIIIEYSPWPQPSRVTIPAGAPNSSWPCYAPLPTNLACPSPSSTTTVSSSPTPSITRSSTKTASSTPTPTPTTTRSGTPTPTPTPTTSTSPTPSGTPTPSTTTTATVGTSPSNTPTPSTTQSETGTASGTASATSSGSAMATSSSTATSSSSSKASGSPSSTGTATHTGSGSNTPSNSGTPSATPSPTVSDSNTGTPSGTSTPSAALPSASPSPTGSITPSPSASPSITPTVSDTPSNTPSKSVTPSVTPSISDSPSNSPTPSTTSTNSRSGSATSTASGTASASGTPTTTASGTATGSASSTASSTGSATTTGSASATATASSSASGTATGTSTTTATPSPTSSRTPSSSATPSQSPSNYPMVPVIAISFAVYPHNANLYQYDSVGTFRTRFQTALARLCEALVPSNVTIISIKDSTDESDYVVATLFQATRLLRQRQLTGTSNALSPAYHLLVRATIAHPDPYAVVYRLGSNLTVIGASLASLLQQVDALNFGAASVIVSDISVPPVVPRYSQLPGTTSTSSSTVQALLGLPVYAWIAIGVGAGVLLIIGVGVGFFCGRKAAPLPGDAAGSASLGVRHKKQRRMNSLMRLAAGTGGNDDDEGDDDDDEGMTSNPMIRAARRKAKKERKRLDYSVATVTVAEPFMPMEPPRPIERVTFDFAITATTNPYHLMYLGDPAARDAIDSAIGRAAALSGKLSSIIEKVEADIAYRKSNLERSGVKVAAQSSSRVLDAVVAMEASLPSSGMRKAELTAINVAKEDLMLLQLRHAKYTDLIADLRRLRDQLDRGSGPAAAREARMGKRAGLGVAAFAPTSRVALESSYAAASSSPSRMETVVSEAEQVLAGAISVAGIPENDGRPVQAARAPDPPTVDQLQRAVPLAALGLPAVVRGRGAAKGGQR